MNEREEQASTRHAGGNRKAGDAQQPTWAAKHAAPTPAHFGDFLHQSCVEVQSDACQQGGRSGRAGRQGDGQWVRACVGGWRRCRCVSCCDAAVGLSASALCTACLPAAPARHPPHPPMRVAPTPSDARDLRRASRPWSVISPSLGCVEAGGRGGGRGKGEPANVGLRWAGSRRVDWSQRFARRHCAASLAGATYTSRVRPSASHLPPPHLRICDENQPVFNIGAAGLQAGLAARQHLGRLVQARLQVGAAHLHNVAIQLKLGGVHRETGWVDEVGQTRAGGRTGVGCGGVEVVWGWWCGRVVCVCERRGRGGGGGGGGRPRQEGWDTGEMPCAPHNVHAPPVLPGASAPRGRRPAAAQGCAACMLRRRRA